MSPAELLLDMRAAHAARQQYQRAAELHAAKAMIEFANDRRDEAREQAGWANRCQRWAASEYEVQER